ncbi:ABC transporter permease [Alkalihalobacillus alcalophilus ATCC 27647 = CGMCC 1.3604]|nr:methionine ABC transporter permease [Alkalihalobacillus alcalophilus]KGA97517.1 ABC transporter permease [Alkalihalobacillus alcalophilus ATCC 27647 = CGMCC 1.3604]
MNVDWTTFWPRILEGTGETLFMVIATLIFGSIIGITFGLLLFVTRENNILENKIIFQVLNIIINIIRPIPFIIFLVAISQLTRLVMGTTIGTAAAIFPMTIVASFTIARVVENNLVSIDPCVIEAAQAMGASPLRIIFTVLIPEALGPLVLGLTFVTVMLIDFSAVAGTVGGGGLGHIAMTYGYQRFDGSVMLVTVLILIILVQVAQWIGNTLSKK